MIEQPVDKERFQFNILSNFSVSKREIEREIGSIRALLHQSPLGTGYPLHLLTYREIPCLPFTFHPFTLSWHSSIFVGLNLASKKQH